MDDLMRKCGFISSNRNPDVIFTQEDSVYHNTMEAMMRIETILHYTQIDSAVIHRIDWYSFCDAVKIVAYAANCLKTSDDLAQTLANKSGIAEFASSDLIPIRPETILASIDKFQEKMLNKDSLKLHKKMVEGKLI